MRMIASLVLTIAAICLANCAIRDPHETSADRSRPPADWELLTKAPWELKEVGGRNVNLDSLKAQPYIKFGTDSRLDGMAGCNRVFGGYETDGWSLKFNGLGTTKMFCPSGMQTEAAFLEALDHTTRFKLVSDTLYLLDSSLTHLARLQAGQRSE